MMFQSKAKLIKNIAVTKKYYKIVLSSFQIANSAKPGQFLQVKISEGYEPLLRRPFSIHRVGYRLSVIGYRSQTAKPGKPNTIEILYEVVGKGTEILSQKKTGERLDIIGPLGNGFDYRTSYIVHRTSILVAGGIGVAPLLFLAEKLIQRKPQTANRKPLILVGAKTKSQILCEKEFKDLGCDVKIATDDGSKGFKGNVTELLRNILRSTKYEVRSTIYACGPRPMLKEIAAISKAYNIPAQISLEEHMACGIGACLGCTIETKEGYKRVCKEGPVFNSKEVVWE